MNYFLKLSFLFVLIATIVTRFFVNSLPDSSEILPELHQHPSQQQVDKAPFYITRDDIKYKVNPLFEYELYGLIVSQHRTDSFGDIYHRKWNDVLNQKDLCVLYNHNVKANIYDDFSFKSGPWTCYFHTNSREAFENFDKTGLSNNHLLSEDGDIEEQIIEADIGDQIHFKGYLAEYSHNSGRNFFRGTSTTREDTGNHACETIFVTEFEILKKNPSIANKIYLILKILLGLITVFGVFRFFKEPKHLKELNK